jgi:alpha-ketoglutarate-dependent taurine dioxygenase
MDVTINSILNSDGSQIQPAGSQAEPVTPGSNILLLLPPFYTPYTPPLGISVLKSYIAQYGYHVKCYDFNTIPHIWVAHHKYFETLQQLDGLTQQHGYTNLWYILQAHMMAHLNGATATECAALLEEILPIYELKPRLEVVNGLIPIVATLFSDIDRILRDLDLDSYAVIGTSTYSTSLAPSLYILKRVKERYPEKMTVMGGGVFADDLADHSDNLATLLREFDYVDHIVMGEGEVLLRDLLNGRLRSKRVLMRDDVGGTPLKTTELGVPDYTDFQLQNYLHLCIEGARSCPFQCSFCSETVQWGGYRKKPAGVLADQMIYLAERYGNKTFFMGDSLMNPYIEDLSTSLLKKGAPVLYDGYLRADKIATDKQRVERWARSGCVRCRLGIESASAKVLDAMNKKTTPAGISKAIKTLASAGIRVTTLWIVGFPGETEEDFQETIDFIREHHQYIYELDVHYYYYYPYGQVWSRLHQCNPLYSEWVTQWVKFQQWEIINCDPPRRVKFERLRRINDLATELGIPNLHTLQARYAAEERWQKLFPLATEFFEGTLVPRKPFTLPKQSQALKIEVPPTAPSRDPAAITLAVEVSKKLEQDTLRQAVEQLVLYNDVLQYEIDEGGIGPVPLRQDSLSKMVKLTEHSRRPDLVQLIQQAGAISHDLTPKPGDLLRVLCLNGPDSAYVALVVHRGIADARTAVLLLEDLVRIYEQLANGQVVTLRERDKTYRDFLLSSPAGETVREVPAGTLGHEGTSHEAMFPLQPDPVKKFTPGMLRNLEASFVETLLAGTVRSLAGDKSMLVECRADMRLLRPEFKDTCGPMHFTCTVKVPERAANMVQDVRNVRKALHEVMENRESTGAVELSITLEYSTDEPWLGTDEWVSGGFIVKDDFCGTSVPAVRLLLKGNRVWASIRYGEADASKVDAWRTIEAQGVDTIWQKILADQSQTPEAVDESNAAAKVRRFARRRARMQQDLVNFSALEGSDKQFPLVVTPTNPDLNGYEWARANRQRTNKLLHSHGAVLFRGFNLRTPDHFRSFIECFTDEALEFSERAAPRIEVANRVYTSTEYPPEYPIPLHHENAFAYKWPMKVFFFCHTPSATGGATPIADDQDFFKLLDPVVRETFWKKKVMYVRNYGAGVDLPWQEVFNTHDKATVESYCRLANTECQWLSGDRLRTTRVAPAIIKHPTKDSDLWFNHAHLFHVSNLEPTLRESLLRELGEEGLPRNTYFGDGTPIDDAMLEHVRQTYEKAAVRFAWQQGDVLLVENMAVAHGRESFAGERKILVIMAESSTNIMRKENLLLAAS